MSKKIVNKFGKKLLVLTIETKETKINKVTTNKPNFTTNTEKKVDTNLGS